MVLRLISSHQPLWRILILCQLYSGLRQDSAAAAGECDGARNVFAKVKENSPEGTFITSLSFTAEPSANHMRLRLSGKDAPWFYLEGKTIRLNSSSTRILDREIHGSVLKASVRCYEHKTLQAEHSIVVEVLNENDNKPEFLESSTQPLQLSELTAVNSVVFTVQATDADGDTLTYIIDDSSPDAGFFQVDLPNTGKVSLIKSLDYEIKTQLRLTLFAVETHTTEHYNTTATIMISVMDGDDQYPQFQPCTLLSASHSKRICANPLYTANITENEQDMVLDFFPGPIHAVDGDEGLRTPIKYSILSGADNGRFIIDGDTGEVKLTRRVANRLQIPTLRLRVMAAQTDDPLKYAVATVLVRVQAENKFHPQFNRSMYRGFVSESTSPASFVMTYGNRLLTLEAVDQDFSNGFNPRLQYSLNSHLNSSGLFYITQEGLLIAKTDRLHRGKKYFLEVLATDLESGDTVKAELQVEVLQKDQSVPQGPLGVGQLYTRETVGRAEGVAGVCVILLAVTLFTLVRCVRLSREKRDQANQSWVADSSHPNVRLKWFQMVNYRAPKPPAEEALSYHTEAFYEYDYSASPFYGKQGIYTKIEEQASSSSVNVPTTTFNKPIWDSRLNHLRPNGMAINRFNKTLSFQNNIVDEERDEYTESTVSTEVEDCSDLEEMNAELENEDVTTDSFCTNASQMQRDCERDSGSYHELKADEETRILAHLPESSLKVSVKHKFKSNLSHDEDYAPEVHTNQKSSIYKGEPFIINTEALVSKTSTEKHSEDYKSDSIRTSHDLSTDPLASQSEDTQGSLYPDTEQLNNDLQTLLDTITRDSCYVNEDIATSLDDSGPDEESESCQSTRTNK
ncbi:hypothetical protein DNTS_017665 [Danionella cerebrum]|uniref:Cadherin domain-containing protein n=1 Tax=Danionella cerebrum TaxID=2873325 RepID=A0A553MXE9_9TELE|nr:hypothetical protein DNTS_017665 [Danionella translucida]